MPNASSPKKLIKYKVYVYQQFLAFAGDKPAREISIQLIEAYLRTRPTNINYNRHRKDLCALFTWTYKRRLISENPSPFLRPDAGAKIPKANPHT